MAGVSVANWNEAGHLDVDVDPQWLAVEPGSAAEVRVQIRNAGHLPVLVNTRLAPGAVDEGPGELFVEVTTEDGEAVGFEPAWVPVGPATETDFEVLEPGETRATTVDLSAWAGLSEPGTYHVVVRYQADHDPGAPANVVHGVFTGEPVKLIIGDSP